VRPDAAEPGKPSDELSVPVLFTLVILIKMRGFPVSMKNRRRYLAAPLAGSAQERLRLPGASKRCCASPHAASWTGFNIR
jgi:hypothetical protein